MAARKKKTTTRKKKVSEANYKVSKTRSNVGIDDTNDDTIDAQNSAEALEKSMKNDPNKGKYDSVEVSKGKGESGAVRTKSQTTSKVEPKGLGEYANVKFPYYLGLPLGWKPLFESLTKKIRENLVIGTRYGKLHIQVPDEKTMETLVTEVEKKARGKTAVKHMAKAVANGINESVKK